MSVRSALQTFVVAFVVTFVVAISVNFVWNLVAQGSGSVEWQTPFRLAIILGIVLTWMAAREPRGKS